MPAIETLYITRWALTLIEREARSFSVQDQIEDETGGFLVGRRLNEREFIILAATGPGPLASHTPFAFAPDTAYGNQRLQEYRLAYPDADYVGTWHKHPVRYPTYSQGDLDTAWSIFGDRRAYKLEELICPIVWVYGGRFYLNCYYMDRALARQRQPFQIIPTARISILSDQADLLRHELKRLAPLLKLRLGEECEVLQRIGFSARLGSDPERSSYLMEVAGGSLGARRVYCEIPQTYPERPPTLFIETPGKEEPQIISEERLSADWSASPATSLLVLVEQVATMRRAPPELAALSQFSGTSTSSPDDPAPSIKYSAGGAIPWLPAPVVSLTGVVVLLIIGLLIGRVISSGPDPAPTPSTVSTPTPSTVSTPAATATADERWAAVEAAGGLDVRVRLIEDLLRDGVNLDPEGTLTVERLFEARRKLSQAHLASGNYTAAIDVLKEAAASPPSDEAVALIADDLALAYLAAAEASLATGGFDQARAYYEALLSQSPAAPPAAYTQAEMGVKVVDQKLETRKQIAAAFATYEERKSDGDWPAMIAALDTVSQLVGLPPDLKSYPPEIFGAQIGEVPGLLFQARLAYAAQLQLAGRLETKAGEDSAAQQYGQILDSTPLAAALSVDQREQAEEARGRLIQGRDLWQQVNASLDTSRLGAAYDNLIKLRKLDDFGPKAHNPERPEQTVASLLVITAPTPTSTPRPTATPSPTVPLASTPSSGPSEETTPVVMPQTSYIVSVRPSTLEELTGLAGTSPPSGVNAFIDGEGDLSLVMRDTGGGVIIAFNSNDRWVLAPTNRAVVIQVLSNSRGPVISREGVATFVPDIYYLITVIRTS